MKNIFNSIAYLFFLFWVGLLRLIPWKILFGSVPTLAFLLRKMVRYRLKTVENNLSECGFTEQNHVENFYKTLVRHLLETIKGFSTSPDALKARYKIKNPDLLKDKFEKGQSVLLIGSHYNNWEWGIQSFNLSVPHQIYGIYQYVSNPYIHQFLMRRRTRGGMRLIPYDQAIKQIAGLPPQSAVMILADQSPPNVQKAIWALFLGRKTPFVHSLEALRAKAPYPMLYYSVDLIKNGYYEIEFKELSQEPAAEQPGVITRRYAALLEKTIMLNPAPWLWSHKRWKRVTPELEKSIVLTDHFQQ